MTQVDKHVNPQLGDPDVGKIETLDPPKEAVEPSSNSLHVQIGRKVIRAKGWAILVPALVVLPPIILALRTVLES